MCNGNIYLGCGICIEEVFECHPKFMDVLLSSIYEISSPLCSIVDRDEGIDRRFFSFSHLQSKSEALIFGPVKPWLWHKCAGLLLAFEHSASGGCCLMQNSGK